VVLALDQGNKDSYLEPLTMCFPSLPVLGKTEEFTLQHVRCSSMTFDLGLRSKRAESQSLSLYFSPEMIQYQVRPDLSHALPVRSRYVWFKPDVILVALVGKTPPLLGSTQQGPVHLSCCE